MYEDSHFSKWRPHPWHGLPPGPDPPRVLDAFIELTPFDLVKVEVDKQSGYLRVDRPQPTSSLPPTLYGFVPRTYCGSNVDKLCEPASDGDRDPLDICVFSERPINRSEIVVPARVIGGLSTSDHGKADDKIFAVLLNDAIWGDAHDLSALPQTLIERVRHYFATYKATPDEPSPVDVLEIYDVDRALTVVEASLADYREQFGT